MQNHDFAFGVAEDEDVAIAEVGLFDSFFEGHGTHCDSFLGAHEVNFSSASDRGKFVHDHVDRSLFRKPNGHSAPPDSQTNIQTVIGLTEKTAVPVLVHKYPAMARTTEVHLVRSDEAVAMRPMTLEEAIKEAHFRDRDVFVFRDPKGKVMILHRTRDGKMELIEAP